MGQAKRNGSQEERIKKAKERDFKILQQKEILFKKGIRFYHLCKIINPSMKYQFIYQTGKNRGFDMDRVKEGIHDHAEAGRERIDPLLSLFLFPYYPLPFTKRRF